jgi:hypothetical protein
MKLVISEKQLNELVTKLTLNKEITEQGEGDGAPEAGTSSDGEQKTGASVWTTGIVRGAANQIGVTKWADSYKITRGRANPLSEQSAKPGMVKMSKYVYKEDDDENFFVNIGKGEISEALLDLRSFMFSGWGLGAQIVVGVLGSEVGAPIALGAIDAVIVLNDFYLFSQQGMDKVPPENIKDPWERFKWALSNNPDFLRVVEDVIFLATFGVIRGATSVIKYFSKSPSGLSAFGLLLKKASEAVKTGIGYIPGRLGKWANERGGAIKKVADYFEAMNSSPTKAGRMIGKIPQAFYISAVTVLGFEVGLRTLSFILNLRSTINPKNLQDEIIDKKGGTIQKMVQEKNELLADRQKIEDEFFNVLKTFPKYKNLPRSSFSLTNQKKDNETIFIISGVKYYINAKFEIEKI